MATIIISNSVKHASIDVLFGDTIYNLNHDLKCFHLTIGGNDVFVDLIPERKHNLRKRKELVQHDIKMTS